MFNPNAPAVKLFGFGVLNLPVGFFAVSTVGAQVDTLYEAADAPTTEPHKSAMFLRVAAKLQK